MEQKHSTGLPDINQSIIINAAIDHVWQLATSAQTIGTWFMPSDIQPKVGHTFTMQTPFGVTPCKVLEVQPPNLIRFSWDTDGWIVSFILEELSLSQTRFTVIHGGWKAADSHWTPSECRQPRAHALS